MQNSCEASPRRPRLPGLRPRILAVFPAVRGPDLHGSEGPGRPPAGGGAGVRPELAPALAPRAQAQRGCAPRVPQTGLKVNRAIAGPYYRVKITHRLPQPSVPDNKSPGGSHAFSYKVFCFFLRGRFSLPTPGFSNQIKGSRGGWVTTLKETRPSPWEAGMPSLPRWEMGRGLPGRGRDPGTEDQVGTQAAWKETPPPPRTVGSWPAPGILRKIPEEGLSATARGILCPEAGVWSPEQPEKGEETEASGARGCCSGRTDAGPGTLPQAGSSDPQPAPVWSWAPDPRPGNLGGGRPGGPAATPSRERGPPAAFA
ncbi:collagen alpha-1(I) chain-like [Heterocephalus glaber]|uniref:Collagen alpha-1(I) chain-like n=1 Tax=Heterocephalus glaber TaxID=10181 RepID=A0AAX6T9A2_HETGA|nr:collagen alpha-1(I) chain-like [Heterocephalus glaber]